MPALGTVLHYVLLNLHFQVEALIRKWQPVRRRRAVRLVEGADPAHQRAAAEHAIACMRIASAVSGGPVVNADGDVIGVISRGWTGEADSTATHFAGREVSRRTFATLDLFATRRFRGFAAIDPNGDMRFFGPDPDEPEQYAENNGMVAKAISCSPATGEWLTI